MRGCRYEARCSVGAATPGVTLTSMGTALVLLFLLALGAIPGALLPQRSLNAPKVEQYIADHPTIGPWLDRLQAFDVFSSFWFTAIYVLLFISLVGCLVPRMVEHDPRPARDTCCRAAQSVAAAQARRASGQRRACRGRRRRSPTGSRLAPRRPRRRTGSPKSGLRRDICASSATSSSTSRCSGCWSRSRWASCSATRATSSSSRTAAPASAPPRPRRSTPSGRATPSTAPSLPDLRAGQRFPGTLPVVGSGHLVRRQHRLPGRLRPGLGCLATIPARGQPSAADRRRPGLSSGPRLRADVHGDVPGRADPDTQPCSGAPRISTRCCRPAWCGSTRPAACTPIPTSAARTRSRSRGCSRRPSGSTARCCRRASPH